MVVNYLPCRRCRLKQLGLRPVQPWTQSRRDRSQRLEFNSPYSTDTAVSRPSQREFQSSYEYCVDLLRKYDRPSYTLSTFVPGHTFNFYIALRALNVSLSMIPDTTSTSTIGHMRLQFWRDTITRTLEGTPPKEPVAVLLAHALSDLDTRSKGTAKISKGWFMRLISAREHSLNNAAYPNIEALESYAENTYSTLLYLTLSALPLTSLTADHLASHIGKAAGITAVLRGLPLVAFPSPPNHHSKNREGLAGNVGASRQGVITLPLDVMAQAGVKEEDVFRQGADAAGLRDAVFTVATRASDHLITARQMLKNLRAGEDVGHDFEHEGEEGHEYSAQRDESRSDISTQLQEVERGFGVFVPSVATQMWLDRLQKVDFDIFKPDLLSTDWRLPWKAYWAFRRRIL